MDRNVLIEILQQEGNLKHCFSHDEIERLAEHLSIETVQAETLFDEKRGTLLQHGVHPGWTGSGH